MPKKSKGGRPPKDEARTGRINIPVLPEEKEMFESLAKEARKDVAPYVRDLIFAEFTRLQRKLRRSE